MKLNTTLFVIFWMNESILQKMGVCAPKMGVYAPQTGSKNGELILQINP